MMQSIVGTKCS